MTDESSVRVMCLKSNFQTLEIYIPNTIVVTISHYKRMGYVIILKPICSSRDGVNSRCHRFVSFSLF